MRDLNYHLQFVCRANRDGSYGTQKERLHTLNLIANELYELGFRHIKHPQNLKAKHIYALASKWQNPGNPLSIGTIKNRLSTLRWLSNKVPGFNTIHSSNAHYGIENRSFVGPDKAVEFTDQALSKITDPNVLLSAQLQKHFGLRREEALKFNPSYADKGTHISLKPSWCKGGRGRDIPITTDAQVRVLESVRKAVGSGSLIPASLRYVQQMRVFEKQMKSVGLGRSHGARHMYAQDRYEILTAEILSRVTGNESEGLVCVARGGLCPREMTQMGRNVDKQARQIISRELGHERLQICSVYLGG